MSEQASITDTQSLVAQVLQGTLDESSMGTVLKTLQISMAASLISNQNKASKVMEAATSRIEKLLTQFDKKLDTEMEFLELEDQWKWIAKMHNMQITVLDLQRKIIQGKPLFSTEVLSEEEKMVVKLLGSFKSLEEKKQFISVVKDTLEKNSSTPDFDND